MKDTRKKAMDWWTQLGNKDKNKYCMDMYPSRSYISLTGREIENIFTNWTPQKAIDNSKLS